MAKKKKQINLNDPEVRRRRIVQEKGYSTKVFMKLAKRVHADLKKRGENPTWNESQKFVSRYLFSKYKGQYISKIDLGRVDYTVGQIREDQLHGISYYPTEPAEACGSAWAVLRDNPELYSFDWWELQNKLPEIPADVKIRVNAGDQFGYTDIAYAGDIDYFGSGIKAIVEAIRDYFKGASGPSWAAEIKTRPGRQDDGKNCSYFIDFVLEVDGAAIQIYSTPGEQHVVTPPKKEIDDSNLSPKEIKEIKAKRKKDQEARKAQQEKVSKSKNRQRPTSKPKEKTGSGQDYNAILQRLYDEYKEGIIDVKEYKRDRARIYKMMERDGETEKE